MKYTFALAPLRLRDPSKYMVQCSGWSTEIAVCISIHSAMKSVSAYDLIMWRGLMSMV
jgi:hypothetical protein